MSKHFQRDLDRLRQEILAMGGMVEEAINNSILSLVNRDRKLAEEVFRGEDVIDQKEIDIGEECLKILALHQPVAGDLRFIVACMMVNNDLERMADLAANIAERSMSLIRNEPVQIPEDLTRMAGTVREMVKKSLDSLVNEDVELARQVVQVDDEVDGTHRQMYKTMRELIRENPDRTEELIHILSVSRQLERIADHTTNVAEEVVFMVEGEVIRHQPDAGELPE